MRWLTCLVVCCSLTGCATITSRMGEDSTWGHSFSSVKTAVDNGEECMILSAISAPAAVYRPADTGGYGQRADRRYSYATR